MADTTLIDHMAETADLLVSGRFNRRGFFSTTASAGGLLPRFPSAITLRAMMSLLSEPPWPLLLAISLLGWAAILVSDHEMAAPTLCIAASGVLFDQGLRAFAAMMETLSPVDVLVSWMVMLTAMMSLILAMPLRHVWYNSLRRSRVRNVGLFLTTFIGVWLFMAPVIGLGSICLRVLTNVSGVPVIVLVIFIASLWQVAPWKQICLNRCHQTPRLSAFGWPAARDCIAYGINDVVRCVGTCWALMLIPLAVPEYHLVAMVVASAIMIRDRLQPARPIRWYVPGIGFYRQWQRFR